MTSSTPDDMIWPVSNLLPDDFSTIARVLSAEASPCWRFVIGHDSHQELYIQRGGEVFGAFVTGKSVPLDQSAPIRALGAPYAPADAFAIQEVLTAWYAGPRDTGKMCIFFEERYGVKLRRAEKSFDWCRAQLVYPRNESERFGKTCLAAFALGWRWDRRTRQTLFQSGTSPGDISQLAALIELTATEVFNAHKIIEVWVAPFEHYRS